MATNNLATKLEEAKITTDQFAARTHLTKATVRSIVRQKRTPAPKTQGSLVKALNTLLKASYTVEDIFPPKK